MQKKLLVFSITIIILISFLLSIYAVQNNKIFNNKYSPSIEFANNDNAMASDLKEKIYFFNTKDSDFILIASNGHYGLVDASNRYSNSITDSDNTQYDISVDALSSQTYFTNGKDVAKYMVNALGVDHLDFVVGTHAHSDHIGGIDEICQQKLSNDNYLVDSRTRYFYKTYYHMRSPNDDLDENENKISVSGAWHNQAFVYTAKKAMQDRGAKLINISNGAKITENNQIIFPDISNIQGDDSHLSNATYNANNLNNYYDDFIEFHFGNYNIRLYNLFTSDSKNDENVNSILTLITKGNSSILLTGDINIQDNTEVLLAQEIYNYVGHIDLYKMAHHTNIGSNSKELLDILQPKYCVGTRKSAKTNEVERGYFLTRYYATRNYNTTFYETCLSDKAIVVTVEDNSLSFNDLYDTSNTADNPNTYNPNLRALNSRALDIQNDDFVGWNRWSSYGYSNWMYLEKDSNNQYSVKTEWFKKGDYWYFADSNGLLQHGWKKINGNWYYFAYTNEVLETETQYYPEGAMVKGWKVLKWNNQNYWFYLTQSDSDVKIEGTETYYPEGAMITGWQQMNFGGTNYWFYFARNHNDIENYPAGAMITGRQYVDYLGNRNYYYFAKSTDEFSEYVKGAMVKNKTIDGYTYNANGICTNNDITKPTITANNITYGDSLGIRLQDNRSGVVAWQINTSSSEPTSGWTSINNTTDITVTKTGLSAGAYYIWAKDADRNVASKQVTVSKKPIVVEWEETNTFIYNGNNQGPTLTNNSINGVNNEIVNLEVQGYKQEIGTNYTATAIISSVTGGQANKNNYSLTGNTKIFSIIGKDISNLTASLSETTYVYDGTAKEPTEEVKDGETRLIKGTDYTLQYLDNINAGTGKAIITGIGTYRGTKNLEFTINKKTIEIPTYLDKTYNAKEQSIVAQEGYNLEGTTKATNVSTNTVTAKLIDTANTQWSDTTTNDKTITWKIVGYNLSNSTIATIGTQEYTGSEITPTPRVTVAIPNGSTTTLINNTDFTYSYANNINNGNQTATVTITGKGNYTGTKSKSFSIAGLVVKATASNYTGIYDGNNHGINVTVTDPTSEYTIYYKEGNEELTETNYTTGSTTSPEKKDAGTYTIQWYVHSSNSNYSDVSGSNTITIGKKQIEVDWNDEAVFTYNGNNQGPTLRNNPVNGVNNEKINLEVQGYKKDVGENYTATVIISSVTGGQANNNNYSLTGNTKIFSIIGKDISNLTASLSETTYVYDGTAKEPTEEVKDGETRLIKGTDYTLQYVDNINAGTGKAIITGIGTYRGTKNLEFTINKKTIEIPTYLDKTYNATEQSIVAQEGYNLEGTTKATNVSTNTVTAKLIDTANTQWSDSTTNDKTITWKIVGYNLSNSTIATIGIQEYTGSEITPTPRVTVAIPNGSTTTLINNTDFTYSYANNINKGNQTATVTITGKGNYTGTKSKSFSIAGLVVKATASNYTGIYDGNNHGINVTVTDPISEYTVYYKEGNEELTETNFTTGSTTSPEKEDAGAYTIQWYVHSSNSNYSDVSGSNTITIGKKQIEVDWNDEAVFTYNGNNQGPTLRANPVSGVNNEIVNLEVQGYKQEIGTNYTATAIISSVTGGQANKNNYNLTRNTKNFSIINNNSSSTDEGNNSNPNGNGNSNTDENNNSNANENQSSNTDGNNNSNTNGEGGANTDGSNPNGNSDSKIDEEGKEADTIKTETNKKYTENTNTVKNTDNNNSNSSKKISLPYTGKSIVGIMMILVVIMISIYLFIKYRKYKDI